MTNLNERNFVWPRNRTDKLPNARLDVLPTVITVMNRIIRTTRSRQTVQTQIRVLLEEQSDQGLHCLLFHLHLFDEIPQNLASFLEF